ncbi:hypothetical protein [Brevibacillus panacihumi]|uniref:Uncharacterized protein n=1 Tax=Brevibacillus panacihumi TaxID=497735 RepID=A0A3M8DFW9_9BACL|nr:hypothetical protein [Brevibacillus panacihumi]RNB86441.1 hypothetical protein EDM58_02575 [Brevibacillus panacihumi]
MDQLRQFKQFIDQAEQVWTQIAASPRGKPVYTVNGVDYTPLPERYGSKRKISRIFRRYWGIKLTERMIRNLRLRLVKGKLCVPYRVYPPLPMKVESLKWRKNGPNQKVISAVLSGGSKNVRVDYRFIRSGNTVSFTIMKRSNCEYDLRYRAEGASTAHTRNQRKRNQRKKNQKGRNNLLKPP